MVININMELEARMQAMYKSLVDTPKTEERKELSPNEFWNTMQMVSMNNKSLVNYRTK